MRSIIFLSYLPQSPVCLWNSLALTIFPSLSSVICVILNGVIPWSSEHKHTHNVMNVMSWTWKYMQQRKILVIFFLLLAERNANSYHSQCCQVWSFPAQLGYFYTVAVGSLRVKVIFTECNFDGMDPRQMGKQWENTVIQLDKVPLKC